MRLAATDLAESEEAFSSNELLSFVEGCAYGQEAGSGRCKPAPSTPLQCDVGLVASKKVVTPVPGRGPMPVGRGGSIRPGDYVLVAMQYWGELPGPAFQMKATLRMEGGTYAARTTVVGDPTTTDKRVSGTTVIEANRTTSTELCPARAENPTATFTATETTYTELVYVPEASFGMKSVYRRLPAGAARPDAGGPPASGLTCNADAECTTYLPLPCCSDRLEAVHVNGLDAAKERAAAMCQVAYCAPDFIGDRRVATCVAGACALSAQ